jgi:hypothetical protein
VGRLIDDAESLVFAVPERRNGTYIAGPASG